MGSTATRERRTGPRPPVCAFSPWSISVGINTINPPNASYSKISKKTTPGAPIGAAGRLSRRLRLGYFEQITQSARLDYKQSSRARQPNRPDSVTTGALFEASPDVKYQEPVAWALNDPHAPGVQLAAFPPLYSGPRAASAMAYAYCGVICGSFRVLALGARGRLVGANRAALKRELQSGPYVMAKGRIATPS